MGRATYRRGAVVQRLLESTDRHRALLTLRVRRRGSVLEAWCGAGHSVGSRCVRPPGGGAVGGGGGPGLPRPVAAQRSRSVTGVRTRGRMTGRWASTSRATSITEVPTRTAWSFRACVASSRVRPRRWARTLAASRSSRSSRSRSRSRPVRATVSPVARTPAERGRPSQRGPGRRRSDCRPGRPVSTTTARPVGRLASPSLPPEEDRQASAPDSPRRALLLECSNTSMSGRVGDREIPSREWMERARTVPRGGPTDYPRGSRRPPTVAPARDASAVPDPDGLLATMRSIGGTMSRATRIVTMWTSHHKVRVSVYGDADADPDLAVRLEVALGRLLHAGAAHLVVHLDRLTGDDVAIVDLLANTCQRLWLRRGVMEIVGMREPGSGSRSSPEATDEVRDVRGEPSRALASDREPDLSGSDRRCSTWLRAATDAE